MSSKTPLAEEARCPSRKSHILGPINYVDNVKWSEWMAETHDNQMCPDCRLYVIWAERDVHEEET